MKKLLLYSPIYDYVAESFVTKLQETDSKEDLRIYINSPGGRVFAGWAMIGPMSEHEGKKTGVVTGTAMSMSFFMLLFMDEVEAIDAAYFMVHRADGYVEDEEDQKFLDNVNATIRAKMEKRINEEAFKKLKGYSFDDIFDPNKRINAFLTAKEAKKIGLVDKIIKVDTRELEALDTKIAAFIDLDSEPRGSGKDEELEESKKQTRGSVESQSKKPIQNTNSKSKKMTKEELKAQHPELYAQVYGEGREAGITAGVEQEFDRISSFLAYSEIDPEAVKKGIEEKKPISAKFMAEMNVKFMKAKGLEDAESDSPDAIATEKGKKAEAEEKKNGGKKSQTAAEKELADLEAEVNTHMHFVSKPKTEEV